MEKDSKPGRPGRASTEDVLGAAAAGQSNVNPKWEKHFRSLVRFRDFILQRQKDLLDRAAEESTPPQRNLAERGTDEYDRELALSMASSEQEMLYEIEEALNRIKTGTYGTCELTGEAIEPERLLAIPWTRFSLAAEERLESEGQVHRTRLRPLENIPKNTAASDAEEAGEAAG
jgi:RNA polymerase-binding transcription factor DksA